MNHPIADDCAWRYYTRAPLAEVWHSSWWIAGATDTAAVAVAVGGRVSITADPLGPALLRTESGLVAIDAAGLPLSGPERGRVPVRGDRASWEADSGVYWLDDANGTIMALTGKESLL